MVRIPPSEDGEPTNVTLTATNTFDVVPIDVRKRVTGDKTRPDARGTFEVSLSCTQPVDGEDEPVTVPGGADRKLSPANGYHTTYDDLPANATCTLTETDDGDADSTIITTDANGTVTEVDGTSVEIDLAEAGGTQVEVVVVNDFDGEGTTDAPDGGGGGGGGGILPGTGAWFGPWLLWLAGFLLLAGTVVLALTRRQRR